MSKTIAKRTAKRSISKKIHKRAVKATGKAKKAVKRDLVKRTTPKSVKRSAAKRIVKNTKSLILKKTRLLAKPLPKPIMSVEKPFKPVPMPKIGDTAPEFVLPDANGTLIALSSYRGRKVVLYFYPKDDTPGCTIEAQSFRDEHDLFLAKNAVVIGISKDTCESHRSFIQKYGLNFILLSDMTGDVVEKYGCWVEKNMYGKKMLGIQRATFVIDENGKVKRVFPRVMPDGHSAEVMNAL